MNGHYLASRIRQLSGPIIAFRKYLFRDVLPAFADLDARAERVAHDYYNRIGAQPAGEYEIDISSKCSPQCRQGSEGTSHFGLSVQMRGSSAGPNQRMRYLNPGLGI